MSDYDIIIDFCDHATDCIRDLEKVPTRWHCLNCRFKAIIDRIDELETFIEKGEKKT